MTNSDLNALYKTVLDRVLEDDFHLPSLPDISMKVRAAVSNDATTPGTLTQLISKDPALTAHLIKSAASPIYRRPVPPKTLADVIGLLGFQATSSLVMLHSVRNMLTLEGAVEKSLFSHTWDRLVIKISYACFFAEKLKYGRIDQVQMALLLTEVGSLAVLSAMLEAPEPPKPEIYFQMCREYSKTLGNTLLTKWEVDHDVIKMHKQCGQWQETWSEELNLLDIANLALYYTILHTVENPSLPDLQTLAAFSKIPQAMQECDKPNVLNLVAENDEQIQELISSLK